MSKKATTKARRTPSPPRAARAERKPGIKGQVAALLMAGGEYTLEELLKETGAKEITLRTALWDLTSPKYAGATGALNIVRMDGKYSLAKEQSRESHP